MKFLAAVTPKTAIYFKDDGTDDLEYENISNIS